MATTADETRPGVRYLSPEEGRAQFNAAARKLLGISGEEFIRRWDSGEYDDIADTEGKRHIMRLALLIPIARQDT